MSSYCHLFGELSSNMEARSISNVFLNEADLKRLIIECSHGYKTAQDPFFNNGNKLLKSFVKLGVLSFDDESDQHPKNHVICNVPGCQKEFITVYEYESHYNMLHRYLCHICKKCLPTPHFLDLHILEQHDSYFSVQTEHKPMYSCFLEECKHTSATPNDRKDHCIRVHKFPSNFRFETAPAIATGKKEAKEPLDNDEPMIQGNQHQTSNVIKNFSFGHQKQKSFDSRSYGKVLARKNSKENRMDIESCSALENSKTLEDLMDSLPN